MSPTGKRMFRYFAGTIAGALIGVALALCLMAFALLGCFAQNGLTQSSNDEMWERRARIWTDIAFFYIPIFVPPPCVIIGIIWAHRRNRRDEAKKP